MATLDERVTALEQQLAALLAPDQPRPGVIDQHSPLPSAELEVVVDPAPNPYFALDALKQALPDPGGVVFAGAVSLPGDRRAEWQYGLTTEVLLDEAWAGRAEAIGALGHPSRLQIVQEVLLGMATVAELSQIEGIATSGQVYHHLRTLIAAGWLQTTSRGRYEVPVTRIVPLLALILAARR